MISGGLFDYDNKVIEIKKLEGESNDVNFWNSSNSNNVLKKLASIKEDVKVYEELLNIIEEDIELMDIVSGPDDINLLENDLNRIEIGLDKLKNQVLLSGEFDRNNCYIEIHSGAGGTESNDWANMVKRMYLRYFTKNNYNYEIVSEQDGEEVGIKGVTIYVKGIYAFGYLKGETGVHRLVRISPFDSNKRRHTSFASVLVTPEIDTSINVVIKEEDLRVDVYRSSGAGGQGVNTADSAVRITHIPTNIVVTCQNERSQIKNKEKAMEILKSKLYLLEKETVDKKLNDLKGAVMDVNFGSQIRNYVMCPYSLVKDLRTQEETSDVVKVLDGEIQNFLDSYLRS